MKVSFLSLLPSPYMQDVFRHIHHTTDVELNVMYLEEKAPFTHWKAKELPPYEKVLPGRCLRIGNNRVHVNPSVVRELRNGNFDLSIVSGYDGLTNQLAMRFLSMTGRPWAFWGEIPGIMKRGMIGTRMRRTAQMPLHKSLGIGAVGAKAVDAYKSLLLTMPKQPAIFRNIPYYCEMNSFESAAQQRQSSSTCRFLYCGQLIDRKGVDLLCAAFTRVVDAGHDVSLSLVGTGPLHQSLKGSLSPEVAERVMFCGFKQMEQLPKVFAENDILVLPSRHDGWGVVVNQAIASGMAVIATDAVGAAHDLIDPGKNGFRVSVNSTDAIYDVLIEYARRPELKIEHGHHSESLRSSISLETAAENWLEFFQSCLSSVSV